MEKRSIFHLKEISVGQLAEEIIVQINPKAKIITDDVRLRPGKSEVERLLGSNEKMRKLTNWEPKHTLKQGIGETIKWFKDNENLRQYKADVYNV